MEWFVTGGNSIRFVVNVSIVPGVGKQVPINSRIVQCEFSPPISTVCNLIVGMWIGAPSPSLILWYGGVVLRGQTVTHAV